MSGTCCRDLFKRRKRICCQQDQQGLSGPRVAHVSEHTMGKRRSLFAFTLCVIVMQSGADGSHSVDKWEYLQPENGALTPLLCFVIWLSSECTAAALLVARWTHTHTAAILSVSPQVHSSC